MSKVGAHAAGYNNSTIGICLVGNFEELEPGEGRWTQLVGMCVLLCRLYSLQAEDVVGHRELTGASTLCPGKNMDLTRLRREVGDVLDGVSEAPVYRVIVDEEQVGAFREPLRSVGDALKGSPNKIILEKVQKDE